MRENVLDRLASGATLIADGATGTMLQRAGLPPGLAPEAWILEQPDEIKRLHWAYIQAGSDMILTATFGGNRARLRSSGLDDRVAEINRRAAELARQAAGSDVYVAGDIGPSGQLMQPLGPLTDQAARDMFAEQAQALVAGGVDLIQVETMGDLDEAKAAVEGAQQACGGRLPVFCTMSFDTHGHTSMGVSPTQAAEALAEGGVAALGANCGHAPQELLDILPRMGRVAPDAYLIAKPNAGLPRLVEDEVVYDASPEQMADLARRYVELGVQVVGGCCGSTPAHIAAIAAALGG